jgi:hypothetical protein
MVAPLQVVIQAQAELIQLEQAIAADDGTAIDAALERLPWDLDGAPLATLHELLLSKLHHGHQRAARALQLRADPRSIPVVRQAMEMGFDHLAYTASEEGAIAKWFSWLLYDIGTEAALEVLQAFAQGSNQEVAEEMRYRLAKFNSK